MKRTLAIWLLTCLAVFAAVAQEATEEFMLEPRPKAKTFRIYDATGDTDKTGRAITLVDTDNGVDKGYALDLLTGDVRVYVTYKPWADKIMTDLRNNENKTKVQSFFLFCDNSGRYSLEPDRRGIYSTEEAYNIGERLRGKFTGTMLEYLGGEPEDIYYLSLIVAKEPYRHEQFDLEWIENFEPDNVVADCPLYYTGKLKIGNVSKGFTRKVDIEESAIQVGNELVFQEPFSISGPSKMRLVVDRFVETCDFADEYQMEGRRFAGKKTALGEVDRLLSHRDDIYRQKFREAPYVFPGVKFQKLLWRRTGGHPERDTLEYYRRLTQQEFAFSKIRGEFREVAPDTVDCRIDYNLHARYLSKYPTFWAISPELTAFLPADGGETYPDSATEKKYYHLRISDHTYQLLHAYIEEGKLLQGRYDQVVEGFVPQAYAVRASVPQYLEYWVSNNLYSDIRHQEQYAQLVADGKLQHVRTENGGHRLRFDRDSQQQFLYTFRGLTLQQDSLFLSTMPMLDTMQLTWLMPNSDLYYRLRHVNYLHDFTHADTTSTECTCSRMNPMRFFAISNDPALPDCPPYLNGTTTREDYKPRSKKDDPQSIDREARLTFQRGKSVIIEGLGDNRHQLDSLRRSADDIMGRGLDFAPGGLNRIDTIATIGISSPEGRFDINVDLARHRSEAVVRWVRDHCQINTATEVYEDSVATWLDVAAEIEQNDPEHIALAARIRSIVGDRDPRTVSPSEVGYTPDNAPFEAAMERLRKVQLRFVYTALREPSEETVLMLYRNGAGAEAYGAYYYYVLLNSTQLSHDEKLALCNDILAAPRRRGDRFGLTRDVNRASTEQWYDLIRPLAANYIAVDSIRLKKYDAEILRPFIDVNQKGNQTSLSLANLVGGLFPKAYKYVNADFILYNQIQMLLGIGTTASLQSADSLIQILSVTGYSPEFEAKYRPSRLNDLLECYNHQSFLKDHALADRIRQTNLVNYYVINLAIAHDEYLRTGRYSEPLVQENFIACRDSLEALDRMDADRPERYYFRAVTQLRYADMTSDENKTSLLDDARESLVSLFELNDDFVSICQGDLYVRGIYSEPTRRKLGIDVYLEAIEEYIQRLSGEAPNPLPTDE